MNAAEAMTGKPTTVKSTTVKSTTVKSTTVKPAAVAAKAPLPLPELVPLGQLNVHPVTLARAIDHILALIDAGQGGYVVTPNVDHVCLVEHDDELRRVYRNASLVLTDGKPLVWMARLAGRRIPEKVSGSDVTEPLLRAVQKAGKSIFLLGATPEVCAKLVARLDTLIPGLDVRGTASPMFSPRGDATDFEEALEGAIATGADLILFALGSPKQEYALGRYRHRFSPAVGIGVGATFDFFVGAQKRAPKWVSDAGFEWLYRLASNPRRLWRRYLVEDRKIVSIAWRQWRNWRAGRLGAGQPIVRDR